MIFAMRSTVAMFLGVLSWGLMVEAETLPKFDYRSARTHELKPHRRTIPLQGVRDNHEIQIRLTIAVSKTGELLSVKADGDAEALRLWPRVEAEVKRWRFTSFEMNGVAANAEIEEYVDLVPAERLPQQHVKPPALRSDSQIEITLRRSGCYGTCPSYSVLIDSSGIKFEGYRFVVASGKHKAPVRAEKVSGLAQRFINADFYSMEDSYRARVTDNPSHLLCISIDGRKKQVLDYVGSWVGMPAVIGELEESVDALAGSDRWIEGSEGLVTALKAEGFHFGSYEAQSMLKSIALKGNLKTVQELIHAGVPLTSIPPPEPRADSFGDIGARLGILTSASDAPAILKEFMDAGAEKTNQEEKNKALAAAAGYGSLDAARLLIAYGADPNADLRSEDQRKNPDNPAYKMNGPGSVLINAANSGDPNVIREILKYHPDLEARGFRQRTAIFAAGEGYRNNDARAECVRLLAMAGANLNVRDYDGNTPLHEIYLTNVLDELLRLGADVNARNEEGETPIFTNVSDEALALFIARGADLTILNKKGQTVFEAAKAKGRAREEALRKAVEGRRR